MERSGLRVLGFAVVCLVAGRMTCEAVPLDKDGDIKLGVRTYVNARIGTENTTRSFSPKFGSPKTEENITFPYSPAGHLRQNRYFIEAELDMGLDRFIKDNVGPFSLVNALPFQIRGLKGHLTFRGEGDSLYDWGPKEYSTAQSYRLPAYCVPGDPTPPSNCYGLPIRNPATGYTLPIGPARDNLRKLGTDRERLFQAYVEGTIGPVFARFGRQILSWGETDGFRLLDNINPLDSSFGGFLISLDERRVPLDMLRLQYFWGNLGPFSEGFLEMYGAIDNKVGFYPGTPEGSPWTLPNLGKPSATTQGFKQTPARTFSDIRGGGRLVFNVSDSTFSLAHYYTYFDTPAVQSQVRPLFPADVTNPMGPDVAFGPGFSAQTIQSAPMVQVTGASTTFALPSLYTVVRSEAAYFHNQPRFSQQQLDPFFYHLIQADGQDCRAGCDRRNLPITGGRRTGDSFNYVLGFDINQYIRYLNPQQTFFISTQFFYSHLFDALPRLRTVLINPANPSQGHIRRPSYGEVLPVPAKNVFVPRADLAGFGAVEPDLVHQPTDSFLQTLFIGTSYYSGKVNPGFVFFYDWGGAFVYQPSLTLVQDPFRFTIDYSILQAHTLKGGSGVSLLQDRDNVQFRLEYVI